MEPVVGKAYKAIVTVQPSKIVISYGGMMSSGLGEKEIRIDSITGIQIKKPGLMLPGFIEFIFQGGKESRSIMLKSENRLIIKNKKQYEDMQLIKEAIEGYIDENVKRGPVQQVALSEADELAKFAKLRDDGVITQEDFDMKKREILGL